MTNSWRLSASVVPVSQILSSETGKNTLHLFIKWKQLQRQPIFGNFSPYLLVGTRSSLNHILQLINKPNKLHHSKYKCQLHQREQISNSYIAFPQQSWKHFMEGGKQICLYIRDLHMDLSLNLFHFITKAGNTGSGH